LFIRLFSVSIFQCKQYNFIWFAWIYFSHIYKAIQFSFGRILLKVGIISFKILYLQSWLDLETRSETYMGHQCIGYCWEYLGKNKKIELTIFQFITKFLQMTELFETRHRKHFYLLFHMLVIFYLNHPQEFWTLMRWLILNLNIQWNEFSCRNSSIHFWKKEAFWAL
jgi:hypothetical protein